MRTQLSLRVYFELKITKYAESCERIVQIGKIFSVVNSIEWLDLVTRSCLLLSRASAANTYVLNVHSTSTTHMKDTSTCSASTLCFGKVPAPPLHSSHLIALITGSLSQITTSQSHPHCSEDTARMHRTFWQISCHRVTCQLTRVRLQSLLGPSHLPTLPTAGLVVSFRTIPSKIRSLVSTRSRAVSI